MSDRISEYKWVWVGVCVWVCVGVCVCWISWINYWVWWQYSRHKPIITAGTDTHSSSHAHTQSCMTDDKLFILRVNTLTEKHPNCWLICDDVSNYQCNSNVSPPSILIKKEKHTVLQKTLNICVKLCVRCRSSQMLYIYIYILNKEWRIKGKRMFSFLSFGTVNTEHWTMDI